jgi:hypothetical protein
LTPLPPDPPWPAPALVWAAFPKYPSPSNKIPPPAAITALLETLIEKFAGSPVIKLLGPMERD